MSIPAFRRGVTLVCGIAGSLTYHAVNALGERVDHKLLTQPERSSGLTKSASMTQLAMDLYLEGSSLWYVNEVDVTTKFPIDVRRVPFNEWTQDDETGEITLAGEKQKPEKVRLFVAPFPGLLSAAGPTAHLSLRLQALTLRYANSPQAREFLRGLEGLSLEDEQIEELLANWIDLRNQGVTAYLPPDFELGTVPQMTPEQMTLNGANAFLVEQAARLMGIDGFWLGVGQSSGMTYSNRVDLRQDFIDFVLMPALIKPIEERLSLNDCTPNGQFVRANLDAFLRASTKERYDAHAIGLDKGFLPLDEVRELENRPSIDPPEDIDETE